MNPDSYAAPHGSGRAVPVARRGEAAAAVLAGVVWAVVLLLGAVPAGLVLIAAFWDASEGQPVGGMLLGAGLFGIGIFAVPAALTFVPPARRLSVPARFLLAGVLALPLTFGLLVWIATRGG
ncbi:hypothetical protein [Streptomyces sp. NPDC053431]|uniref:hypothetical protein n=1 Tax=Streptomyces sp. NPDC053431 TaxID=3365703 RepID=UPI0037D7BCFE